MTMVFVPGWDTIKINPVPVLGPTPSNKQLKQKKYIEDNNKKRADGAIFLTLFNETEVRNAVQRGHSKFNSADGQIKTLFTDMIGSTVVIRIDQGTHQDEDVDTGGFKLHFDARRPDNLCFHIYVGQEIDGKLKIIEVSFMIGPTQVVAFPT